MGERRDPVDRVVDLMVALPWSTAVALGRAVPAAWHHAQRRALPVVDAFADRAHTVEHAVEHTVDDALDAVADRLHPPTESDATSPEVQDADVSDEPAATDVVRPEGLTADELPIDGYDALAARQVVARLADLFPEELDAIERYEVAHRHRQTVLHRIAQLRT